LAPRTGIAMTPNGIITLLTDFGLTDPFVGVMKGVILARFLQARLVDLTHGIAPQSIGEAAFWLERAHVWFPEGTVHLVVVDPGVGAARKPMALQIEGHCFVGPDNGVLSAVARAHTAEAREIQLAPLGCPAPSRTFHGRDIFAPAAAALASGQLNFADLGPRLELTYELEPPQARDEQGALVGEVVTIDHFGNVFTNLDAALLPEPHLWLVQAGPKICRICETYADALQGEIVGVLNSWGVLEISQRNGNAAQTLNIQRGAPIRAERQPRA
jgi:S-adenosylmethionine hydrolase